MEYMHLDDFIPGHRTFTPFRDNKRFMACKSSCGPLVLTSSEGVAEVNPSLELRENDKVFKEKFAALYNNERLSDIVLHVGDAQFFAHKFMLVVCSEVFEAMLNEERWRESKMPEITLTEVDECVPFFSHFLKFMYTGSVSLTTDNVLPILLLADKYSLPALGQTCAEYMLHHVVESPDTNRTLSWYQYAKMTANSILVDKCRKFILSNFDIILKTNDWMDLTKSEVIEFLSSNDLVVSDEYFLWQKTEKWLSNHKNEADFVTDIKDIVSQLHFTMIPPKQLLEIEKSSLYQDHTEAFMEKINAAYRHHSLLFDAVEMKCGSERFRNYTSDLYGLCFDLSLLNYRGADKAESKMSKRVNIPLEFISTANALKERNTVLFDIVFCPKGPFKAFSWYGCISENATLSVRLMMRQKPQFDVNITFIVFGIKNGVRYVAYSYTNTHKYTLANNTFVEDNLMIIKKLTEDNSPYLVNGNLEAKIFIKVMDIVQPEKSPAS